MALWAFWCVWQGVTLSAWCRLCGVSVSGLVLWLSVWLSGGLLWLWWSSLALVVFSGCGGLWSGCVSLVVSVALLVCCAWCCVSGAVVLSGVGLFSGGLVCCLLVSGGVFSGLVFWCLVWCLVYYQQYLKFLCTRKECHIT